MNRNSCSSWQKGIGEGLCTSACMCACCRERDQKGRELVYVRVHKTKCTAL